MTNEEDNSRADKRTNSSHGSPSSVRCGVVMNPIDRNLPFGSTDSFLGRIAFSGIAYRDCDDLLRQVFEMADEDLETMYHLLTASMAIFVFDLLPEDIDRREFTDFMFVDICFKQGVYDRVIGDAHHDICDTFNCDVQTFERMFGEFVDSIDLRSGSRL